MRNISPLIPVCLGMINLIEGGHLAIDEHLGNIGRGLVFTLFTFISCSERLRFRTLGGIGSVLRVQALSAPRFSTPALIRMTWKRYRDLFVSPPTEHLRNLLAQTPTSHCLSVRSLDPLWPLGTRRWRRSGNRINRKLESVRNPVKVEPYVLRGIVDCDRTGAYMRSALGSRKRCVWGRVI